MTQKKVQKIGRLPLLSKKIPKNVTQNQKTSYYKAQLTERQKFRKNFLLTKKQVRAFLDHPDMTMGRATEQLFQRLDMVIYTLCTSNGMYCTLREIRQKIRHGHFLVNKTREKRPTYMCQSTDVIQGRFPKPQSEVSDKPAVYALHYQNLKNHFDKF